MNIQEDTKGDIFICSMGGEVNLETSPILRKLFERLIKENKKKIIVDLAGVSYIDSSGLATLIEMLQRLKGIDAKMRICGIQQKVKYVFEITKLDKLFEMFEDQQKAQEGF